MIVEGVNKDVDRASADIETVTWFVGADVSAQRECINRGDGLVLLLFFCCCCCLCYKKEVNIN